jgi:hypothetical protein
MSCTDLLDHQWPYLVSLLPPSLDIEESARASGALTRRRGIRSAEGLLRLALAYGFCGLSLRQTAAWAQVSGVGHISDVAVLKRLRGSSFWLGEILGALLTHRSKAALPTGLGMRLRLVDATTVSVPGSKGADWRVHMGFDLERLAIDQVELTDYRRGETLRRFDVSPGELVIGDRGYSHRSGMAAVCEGGGHFLIRLNWNTVPLQTREGARFDILETLREIPDAEAVEFPVQTAPHPKAGLGAIPTRLIAVRKTELAAEANRRKIRHQQSRKQKTTDARTLEAASYTFILASLPDSLLTANQLMELYRFRWQIELAFKRLKSVLNLDEMPAKDPDLCRSFLYSKLLAALLLDDLSERFLSFSPWGYPLPGTQPKPLENPARAG